MSTRTWIGLLACALIAATPSNIHAQQAANARFSSVTFADQCRSRLGQPSFIFSPDQRVVSILFQDLSASSLPKMPRRVTVTCRIGLDIQAPAGMRGQLKAASYRYTLFSSGTGEAHMTVRHGRKGLLWFSAWGPRVTRNAAVESGDLIASTDPRVVTPCGGRARFLVEAILSAQSSAGSQATAMLDSIDLDLGVPEQFVLTACKR